MLEWQWARNKVKSTEDLNNDSSRECHPGNYSWLILARRWCRPEQWKQDSNIPDVCHKALNLPLAPHSWQSYNYLPSGSTGKTHCLHEIHLLWFISLISHEGVLQALDLFPMTACGILHFSKMATPGYIHPTGSTYNVMLTLLQWEVKSFFPPLSLDGPL